MYTLSQIRAAVDTAAPAPIVDAAGFPAAAGRPEFAELITGLRTAAADTSPLPDLTPELYRRYERTGDRMTYEGRYFARRGRLNARAAAALIDRRDTDLAALDEILWQICAEYTWCLPAHRSCADLLGNPPDLGVDLFAAETAHTLAEVTGLLAAELPADTVARVREEVCRRVLRPWLDDIRPQRFETMTNNWSAVCAGAGGMAALWIEDDPRRLTGIVDRVQRAMTVFLSGFAEDGGCAEGVSYWVYGYGYFTYFAEALRARTGLDLLTGTEAIAAFPAAVQFGGGYSVSFSDGGEDARLPTGLLTRLRERLGAPAAENTGVTAFGDDHCHRWAHLSRDLLWTGEDTAARAEDGTAYLPDLAWLVDRRTIDGVRVGFAAKGGHNDEPHNHNDLGHFLLFCGGQQLLADLGAARYDKDYFSPRRYESVYASAEGHSVPVVGGVAQSAGRDREAVVAEYRRDGDGVRFALDLSAAYGTPVTRAFDWRAGELVVTDSFAEPGRDLIEVFISRIEPVLAPGEARWRGEHGTAVLTYDPAAFAVEPVRVDAVDHAQRPDAIHRLLLHGRTAPEHRFSLTVEVH